MFFVNRGFAELLFTSAVTFCQYCMYIYVGSTLCKYVHVIVSF